MANVRRVQKEAQAPTQGGFQTGFLRHGHHAEAKPPISFLICHESGQPHQAVVPKVEERPRLKSPCSG